MTQTDNRAVVEHYFAAIDSNKFDELAALFGPGFTAHSNSMPPMNADAVVPFIRNFLAAFPDLRHRVEEILVDGDRVAVRITVSGTHQGELMGVHPSQRPVSFGAIYIFHLANGRIVEQWLDADIFGMLQQIGAIPAQAA